MDTSDIAVKLFQLFQLFLHTVVNEVGDESSHIFRVETLEGELLTSDAISPYIGAHQCSVLTISGKCHQ